MLASLSAVMTITGRNYDLLVPISALLIYLWMRNREPGAAARRWLVAWNVVGIAVLLNTVATAILSLPTPRQAFAFDAPLVTPALFPFYLLPVFMVPLALSLHVFALLKLSEAPRFQRHVESICTFAMYLVGSFMGLMSALNLGHKSPYYAGISLTIVCIGVFVPVGPWHVLATSAAIYITFCGLLAWHSFALVRDEYASATIAFANVPSWLVQAIMPFGFAVMTLRFAAHALTKPKAMALPEAAPRLHEDAAP